MSTRTDVFSQTCKNVLGIQPVAEHLFHPTRKWRFDYAFLNKKIAIEVEGGSWTGGRHTRGYGFNNDMEKYNEAQLLGWRVFRVTPQTLLTNKTFELLKQIL